MSTDSLLEKLDAATRRNLSNFVEAHGHDRRSEDAVASMQWVREGMNILAETSTEVSGTEKKEILTRAYRRLSVRDTNGFSQTYNVGGVIDFLWHTSKHGFSAQRAQQLVQSTARSGCFGCFRRPPPEQEPEPEAEPQKEKKKKEDVHISSPDSRPPDDKAAPAPSEAPAQPQTPPVLPSLQNNVPEAPPLGSL